MADTTTGAVLLQEALKWLGAEELMRQVASLVPLDLDRPEDAATYIGYLVERGVLVEFGKRWVNAAGIHDHVFRESDYRGDRGQVTFEPVYRVALEAP